MSYRAARRRRHSRRRRKWEPADAELAGPRPVFVDRILEAPLAERRARLIDRKARFPDDPDQALLVADILPVDEIGPVERVVQRLAALQRIRPGAELLGAAAVIGVAAPGVVEPLGIHQPLHPLVGRFEVVIPPREQGL